MKIVIEIQGGLVRAVTSDAAGVQYRVVDHDTEGAYIEDLVRVEWPEGSEDRDDDIYITGEQPTDVSAPRVRAVWDARDLCEEGAA